MTNIPNYVDRPAHELVLWPSEVCTERTLGFRDDWLDEAVPEVASKFYTLRDRAYRTQRRCPVDGEIREGTTFPAAYLKRQRVAHWLEQGWVKPIYPESTFSLEPFGAELPSEGCVIWEAYRLHVEDYMHVGPLLKATGKSLPQSLRLARYRDPPLRYPKWGSLGGFNRACLEYFLHAGIHNFLNRSWS